MFTEKSSPEKTPPGFASQLFRPIAVLMCVVGLVLTFGSQASADITIVENGKAKAAVYVPERLFEDPETEEPNGVWRLDNDVALQLRLRESVKDFVATLEKVSGAKIEIVQGAPAADDKRLAILVGELAEAKFGKPAKSDFSRQGHRIVITDDAVGLIGESDLATSYAIYTILHDLGCRWYIPGDLGECLPSMKTITLDDRDESVVPVTLYRGVWYASNDYCRRNRMGGHNLNTGHALELRYLSKEVREAHPEWTADVNGKKKEKRLKWSAPGLADGLAKGISEYLDKRPSMRSISLSPDDGLGYDNSPEDLALDAGDFDPSVQEVSITDRLVWLCNQIIEKVEKDHPDVLFGVLAYGNYNRPPVREKVDPKLIPQIAPITYARAHAITHEGEPNNESYRYLVKGWGKQVPMISYYFYSWFLAEPSSPNPFMHKWAINVPYVYEHGNCKFWQPETTTNYETTMHARYMGQRYAFDHKQSPQEIYDEIHEKFYVEAADEMAAYWAFIDECWYGVDEYSGCGFGHMRRWTPDKMAKARELMNKAIKAAKTPIVQERVELADASLGLFEMFMDLRHDLAEGRFAGLDKRSDAYVERIKTLTDVYVDNYAFGKMRWTPSLYISYHNAFYAKTYNDAGRIAEQGNIITPTVREWKYKVDEDKQAESGNWHDPSLDDSSWKTTDVMVDTWSALGLHNYMGAMTYRTTIDLPAVEKGKRMHLWLGATDGSAKLYVNGKHVPYVNAKGETVDAFAGYCKAASWDITDVATKGSNQVTIHAERTFINELGTGGMLAPVVVYTMSPEAQ